MKPASRSWAPGTASVAAVLALSMTARADSVTILEVPNATDTAPVAVNAVGRIVGYYLDANRQVHGFVRSPRGSVRVFDAPGAYAESAQDTVPTAINLAGRVAGIARVASSEGVTARGFIRDPGGDMDVFDAAADAVRTEPTAINVEGWVAGTYDDANGQRHGFLRWSDGSITRFEIPPLGKVTALAANGDAFGTCMPDSDGLQQGFVRKLDGSVSLFEAPDFSTEVGGVGCGKCRGLLVTGVNPAGRSVGYYGGADNEHHGFVRAPDGTLTTLDVPGANDTYPAAINLLGQIAGFYQADGLRQPFLREVDGTIHTFAIAGAGNPVITDLDLAGGVIGYYTDANGLRRGFLRRP
jgi:uncharacterized membrane protein